MTVLVIGESLADVVNGEAHPGGSPMNVAVGLARLGVGTLLATQFGDDALGTLIGQHLHFSDVSVHNLDPHIERTSAAHVTIGPDGSASYDFDLTWNPSQMPDPSDFDAVHVGSLGTLLQPGADLVAQVVVSADALGIPVSFDPNVRLSVEPDVAQWQRVFDAIAPHASMIKMSDEDALVLFPDLDPAQVSRHVASERRIAAVTMGRNGAVVAGNANFASIPPAMVHVADTIGAGDSFMAAMIAWAATYDWPTASELDATELTDLGLFAASAAAITCSRPGADPPYAREMTP